VESVLPLTEIAQRIDAELAVRGARAREGRS